MSKDDTSSAALSRAKSYFLVSSMIGNSLTFAIGPKLLDDEETPDEHHEQKKSEHMHANGQIEGDEEHANPVNCSGRTAEQQEEHVNETTTLLPDRLAERGGILRDEAFEQSEKQWVKLPAKLRKALIFAWSFLNAPLIGAIVGAIVGLIPPFHRAFFNEPSNGGFFKAWLTASVKNVGELFAALQLVVVGAKLSGSLLKMKKGEASGDVRAIPMFTIFFIRFLLWPV
jgi:predicted permease